MTLSLRNETLTPMTTCTLPDCENPITPTNTGRPAKYCSPTCRATAHRHRHNTPVIAEATMGSATSRGRHPNNAWIINLYRANHNIVIAIGLTQTTANQLAQQINNLLNNQNT